MIFQLAVLQIIAHTTLFVEALTNCKSYKNCQSNCDLPSNDICPFYFMKTYVCKVLNIINHIFSTHLQLSNGTRLRQTRPYVSGFPLGAVITTCSPMERDPWLCFRRALTPWLHVQLSKIHEGESVDPARSELTWRETEEEGPSSEDVSCCRLYSLHWLSSSSSRSRQVNLMLKTSLRTSSKPPRYSCDRLSTLSMMSNLSRTQLSICEEVPLSLSTSAVSCCIFSTSFRRFSISTCVQKKQRSKSLVRLPKLFRFLRNCEDRDRSCRGNETGFAIMHSNSTRKPSYSERTTPLTFITFSTFLRLWISSFMLDPSSVSFPIERLKSSRTAAISSDSNFFTCSIKHNVLFALQKPLVWFCLSVCLCVGFGLEYGWDWPECLLVSWSAAACAETHFLI